MFIIAVLVYLTALNFWWSLFALVLLLMTLNRYFFSSRFSIDDHRIIARYPMGRKEFEWRHIRRFTTDKHGGYLSTRSKPSRLDAYQGLQLYFDDRREEMIAEINSHLLLEKS